MGFMPDPLRTLFARPRLWVGVALFCAGLAVFGTTDDPFKELGLALAIAMVVAVFADALIGEEILERVGAAVKRIDKALERLGIVNEAQAAGVYGICSRYTPEGGGEREIWAGLEEQLKSRKGDFRVIGVAAPCLFPNVVTGDLFQQYMPGSCVNVKVILLRAGCRWAGVRDGLERGHQTKDDIRAAVGYLRTMRGQWGNRVDYKLSDVPVPAFVVITDKWVFVEPYPIAEVWGALGGKTPMLKLGSDTPGYNIWSDTFELLWDYPRLDELYKHAKDLAP